MSESRGKSITFYYYGNDHMTINLYKYIKTNIENNVFMYLNLEDKTYDLLNEFLQNTEKLMVKNDSIQNVIFEDEKYVLEDFLKRYRDDKISLGFYNVIFVIDARYIIENSSKEVFKRLIENIYEITLNNDITVLVLYDFEDYTRDAKYIDKEIIRLSYDKHSHRMFVNEIIPMYEFVNTKSLA
ncbi:hypothetical protein [Clostridium ihumii]|uniref:hypothetical protein n=1 Tax=Clostridium ihumii TaxID=1470356 RepID=UPI000556F279|nr:hypothetical protein [Clostridium ihumii]